MNSKTTRIKLASGKNMVIKGNEKPTKGGKVVAPPPPSKDELDVSTNPVGTKLDGVMAFINQDDTDLGNVRKMNLLHGLAKYMKKWCYIYNREKGLNGKIDKEDYINCIISYLRNISNKYNGVKPNIKAILRLEDEKISERLQMLIDNIITNSGYYIGVEDAN